MPLISTVATAAFLASFVAKLLADAFLASRVAILGSFVGLQYSTNPGVAFGIRFPDGIQELLVTIALGLVVLLAWKTSKTRLQCAAFGLIVGGALENILDRLRDGVVTDFFQVGAFPIFNVADSCITIGVLLLLLDMILESRKKG